MSDRIEYQGTPLPSSLPGIGDASVTQISLPGINTILVPPKYGPVVDLPQDSVTQPPVPTPPVGNDPANPTEDVVNPGPSPQINPGGPYLPSKGTTPCPAILDLLKSVLGCGWFRNFMVCEDGSPKTYYFLSMSEEEYNILSSNQP